jgi:hypothetical protein
MVTTSRLSKSEILEAVDKLLSNNPNTDSLKLLAHFISQEIIETGQPTVMSIKRFSKLEGFSENFIKAHPGEFYLKRIGKRLVVNLIAWRESLSTDKQARVNKGMKERWNDGF